MVKPRIFHWQRTLFGILLVEAYLIRPSLCAVAYAASHGNETDRDRRVDNFFRGALVRTQHLPPTGEETAGPAEGGEGKPPILDPLNDVGRPDDHGPLASAGSRSSDDGNSTTSDEHPEGQSEGSGSESSDNGGNEGGGEGGDNTNPGGGGNDDGADNPGGGGDDGGGDDGGEHGGGDDHSNHSGGGDDTNPGGHGNDDGADNPGGGHGH